MSGSLKGAQIDLSAVAGSDIDTGVERGAALLAYTDAVMARDVDAIHRSHDPPALPQHLAQQGHMVAEMSAQLPHLHHHIPTRYALLAIGELGRFGLGRRFLDLYIFVADVAQDSVPAYLDELWLGCMAGGKRIVAARRELAAGRKLLEAGNPPADCA